jgi:two-component system, chemotaxis family, chemotaxis protein CheY
MLMRKLVMQYLKDLGYNAVDSAINGSDALEKIVSKHESGMPYDIVIMDMNMPIMDGMTLLKTCRRDARFDQTALVMLTGECEKSKVLEMLHAGVTSYIVKPVSKNTLAEKLDAVSQWLEEKKGNVYHV